MYINTVCVYTNKHDSNEKHLGQKKKRKQQKMDKPIEEDGFKSSV